MNVNAWRIVKKRRADAAFSGEGARLYGGRWNSPGESVVYLAENRSLALLEVLVHCTVEDLQGLYAAIPVVIPEGAITPIEKLAIPPGDWRSEPPPRSTQLIGDEWIEAATSAVLRVPAAIVPEESNFVVNLAHPDFARLKIGTPEATRFDARIRALARDRRL